MKKLCYAGNVLLLTALCSVLVLSSVFCMTSAFSLRAPSILPTLTVLCCAVFCAAFHFKRGWIAFLVFVTLLLAAVFFYLDELRASFSALGNFLLGIYNSGYQWFSGISFRSELSAGAVRPAMVCLSVTMSLLVSFSAAYQKSTLLCGLFALPCMISCFVMTDTQPKPIFVLLVLGCMLLLALTQQSRKTDAKRSPLAIVWFAIPAVALVALVCLAAPQEKYDHEALVGSITERINAAWEGVRNDLISTANLTKPETVDLHAQKAAPASQRTVMRVTAEETRTFYLIGMAYEDFSDDTWNVLERQRPDTSAKIIFSAPPSQLTVETVDVSNVLFVPYGRVNCPADTGSLDAYCENGQKQKEYTVAYYPSDTQEFLIPNTTDYLQQLKTSGLFLPEKTREALLLWGEAHLPSNPTPQQIAEAVRRSASYSRYPKAIPEGADLAVYFLNEAESGFCVHFATATAELLRVYGYPSRYVTGYLVSAKAGETVDVPAKSAHAWAEYYDYDRGWVRLDATPAESPQRQPDETQHAAPETSTESEPTQTTQNVTEPARPQNSGDKNPAEVGTTTALPAWVWIVFSVSLAVLTLFARRMLCSFLQQQKLQKGTSNAQLCACWQAYKRLCKLNKAVPDVELFGLAQKASFSQYRSTEEELRRLRQAVKQQQMSLRSAPVLRRLFYQYILAVI